jgi:hypothetical protein
LRNTTAQKRKELEERQKEREKEHNKLKSKKAAAKAVNETELGEYRRLTQEELLNEAKITEEINLASLGKFLIKHQIYIRFIWIKVKAMCQKKEMKKSLFLLFWLGFWF